MLKYSENIQKPSDTIKKVSSMAYSPNLKKFAVANSNKKIYLYDKNMKVKDKISTRGAKKNDNNYIIRSIAFSPDSTILAVAQSDNIIYGYRIGADFGEKKSICTKISTSSSITCMVWPEQKLHEIFFGTAKGQIKIGFTRNHKSQTLYSTNEYVVSIANDKNGKYLVSGHLDGSVYLYNIETETVKKIITVPTVPYALSFGRNIVVGGNDKKITFLGLNGNIIQKFDHSQNNDLRDFTSAYFNPVGETVVMLNYSQFIVYNYNSKRQEWEEKGIFKIDNYYSIPSACWKSDGTKFFTGNLCGSVDSYDVSMKRMRFKGKFELNYLSGSKIKVLSLEKGHESVISSKQDLEILKVEIKKDRFIIAETRSTLILADLHTNKSSEFDWNGSGNEKFEFSNKNLCWISNAGEVSVIQFGYNEIIGTFRTEYVSTKLISGVVKNDEKRYISYLLDRQTISILNLNTRINETTIDHDAKIVSLAFNTNANKLLFRDSRKALFLYDLINNEKQTLLGFCGFFKWVPESDVIVAQSKENLNIWYSSDSPDKKTTINIKGTAIAIKTGKTTSVTVIDNHIEKNIELDNLLIKFGFAIENKNLSECLMILEAKKNAKNEGHWRNLLRISIEEENYFIIERCYAALGEVAKARFVRKLNKVIRKLLKEGLNMKQALSNYEVQTKLLMMKRQFLKAEMLFLEKEEVEKAIGLYQEIHKWEDSLRIAEKMRPDNYEDLKNNYFNWLLETGQEEKAAEIKEKEGKNIKSMQLYLQAGLPVRAGNLIFQFNMSQEDDIVVDVIKKLNDFKCYEKLGEIYAQFKEKDKALDYFIKGEKFRKAINLAKKYKPGFVVQLQEKWGDFLVSENQKESAVNHFIEAGALRKAMDAAIQAHQWTTAISLLSSLSKSESNIYCLKIADKLNENSQFELAEKYYIQSNNKEKAFQMYVENKKIREATKFAKENFSEEKMTLLYKNIAKNCQKEKNFEFAEKLYIEIKKPELAIKMYKGLENWDKMLKLFSIYRPNDLKKAHILIGKNLEKSGNFLKAEKHFIEAGMWTSAVEMYEKRNKFEDCIRICKNYASDRDTVERAKRWDGKIGEVELIRILKKMHLTDSLIDYLSEKNKFTEAFEIARKEAKHKLVDVHLNYAMHLEDEKRYKDAEENYIKAGKFCQAVNMYIDITDFQSALSIARQYDQSLISNIYVQQAEVYLFNKDYEKMELCYINGGEPKLAIKSYLKMNNYSDALRVANKHCPNLVQEITNYIDKGENLNGMSGEELLQQASIWENNHNYSKAIDVYLEISPENFENNFDIKKIWEKAIALAFNFVKKRYNEVVRIVCKRLRDLNCFDEAGDYYETIGMFEEATKCYIKTCDFEKAKMCLINIKNPNIEEELKKIFEEAYKNYLKSKGDAEKLVGNKEVREGLDLMVERGDWIQVISISKSKDEDLFNHYLVKFLQENTKNAKFEEIVGILLKFGMPNNPNNYKVYNKIFLEIFSKRIFSVIGDLKKVIQNFLEENGEEMSNEYRNNFKKLLLVSHLLQTNEVYKKHDIKKLNLKTSLSLVRYIDLIGIDRPFYEAGKLLRDNEDDIQAFMFLNRYLDIFYVIEDPENNSLDENSEFKKTDFPNLENLKLPEKNFLKEDEKLEIRDWLLKITVKESSKLKLRTRECNKCSQDIYYNNLKCPFCEDTKEICHLTGSPLVKDEITECRNCNVTFASNNLKVYSDHFNHCPWCNQTL